MTATKARRFCHEGTKARRILFLRVLVASWLILRVVAAQEVADADLEAASLGRVVRVGGNGRVVELPVEVYVARVLAGEGEAGAGEAAQRALAIAIRTFAAANSTRHQRDGFDLCNSTHCQVIRGATTVSRRAALATAGQVLLHEGKPAQVFYSASCGGRSEAASQVWPGAADHSYLRSAEDDVCEHDLPWTVELSARKIHDALRKAGFGGQRLRDIEVARRSLSGRVARVRLSGLRPDEIAGDDFRLAVGPRELRSTAFTVRKTGTVYRFTGRGYGHGVGLCVIGAGRRAARGESVVGILDRYYPGLTIGRTDALVARTPEPAPTPVPAPPRAGERASGTPAEPPPSPLIVARVPPGQSSSDIARVAAEARDDLAQALGSKAGMMTIELHESIDSFRHATGRPWWVNVLVDGATITLAPVPVLQQRDGLEMSIRIGVVALLVNDALSDRPAWVRLGAARHFARPPGAPRPSLSGRLRCPSDAELTMAVSAPAQREAETRAEVCFARALEKARDWREVR
jgi:stage II sporulation protein D